ncbi:MAG: CDP-alcohol phosphatidyltransferase family protein [Anaerotardibacter sp.]
MTGIKAGKLMAHKHPEEYEVSNKIFTIPNLLSFIRLLMIPAFLVLLLNGYDLIATIIFAVAASTDWVDGQVARRTNSVSRLGQLLDPAVDRLLMISGVIGILLVGRLPLWIVVFVIIRDLILLIGGAYLIKSWNIRVPVIYLGKFATTFLYIGFAGLLLNFPLFEGMGVTSFTWLPGLCEGLYCWGIWFVYIGLVLALITTIYYIIKAVLALKKAKKELEQTQGIDGDLHSSNKGVVRGE